MTLSRTTRSYINVYNQIQEGIISTGTQNYLSSMHDKNDGRKTGDVFVNCRNCDIDIQVKQT